MKGNDSESVKQTKTEILRMNLMNGEWADGKLIIVVFSQGLPLKAKGAVIRRLIQWFKFAINRV